MKKFDAVSKNETKTLDTKGIRENFLIKSIFEEGKIVYNYTLYDRTIIGGVVPTKGELKFELSEELGVEYFLQRREIGFINISGEYLKFLNKSRFVRCGGEGGNGLKTFSEVVSETFLEKISNC